jgi:phage tail sheath protein FI
MAFNSGAPNINFQVTNLSQNVPTASTSIGAMVLASNKGSVTAPGLVTSVPTLLAAYVNGNPPPNDLGLQAAIGFLQQGNQLYIQRVVNGALYGGIEIKKGGSPYVEAPFASGSANPATWNFGPDGIFTIYAVNPGAWDNTISVSVNSINTSNNTFVIQVFQDTNLGLQQLQETWTVSRQKQTDGYGNQQYLMTAINGYSNYIMVLDNPAEVSTEYPKPTVSVISTYFASGSDGSTVTDAQVVTAWQNFANQNTISVNVLMSAGQTGIATLNAIANIAEERGDSFALLDMPLAVTALSTAAQVAWVANTLNLNSTYAAIYSPWITVFDQYNGQNTYIAPSGDVGAVVALTDRTYKGAFGAPCLFNRGIINRAIGISNATTYDDGDLNTLSDGNINPIINDSGFGVVVYDELTLAAIESDLSFIHVQRLINQIQTASIPVARSYLGEPLLPRTYMNITVEFGAYLATLQGLGAFDDNLDNGWELICNNTNNSATDRDNDTINIWMFIRPVQVARQIQINAIITRSSANFQTIIAAGI